MKALTIARLTFREALRRRMIWGVLALSLIFVLIYYFGFAQVKSEFLRIEAQRVGRGGRPGGQTGQLLTFELVATIMVGLGFYTVNFLAGVMTIFASVGTIAGEIESGTFQAIVPKPIARWQLVVGKFLGFAGMIVAYVALMSAGVLLTARVVANYTPANFVAGTALVILVSLVLLALTVLGSTLFQTMANGVVVFMLYGGALLGGLLETLGGVLNINSLVTTGVVTSLILPSDSIWRLASSLLQPNSQLRFDSPIPIAVASPPSNAMIVYAIAYIAVLLGFAVLSFRRRDL
ncbi:MAG TPA: ABC transporter permease subunit [Thermomicrobiales bacterium]|jgi:ABC-type transport system involved in multi-copper enzyme maturation permease subunit